MTDVLVVAVKASLDELAKQALTLGVGLQNAAPPNTQNQSAQYLMHIAEQLAQLANQL